MIRTCGFVDMLLLIIFCSLITRHYFVMEYALFESTVLSIDTVSCSVTVDTDTMDIL